MRRVRVPVGDRAYDVLVGHGVSDELDAALPVSAGRAAIITQADLAERLSVSRDSRVFTVPDGEQAKTLATVEALCRAMADWGMTRRDVVVGVGGGVVTDLAGFVAAVYHRGIPVVHVATTLLAQVDAAIGGKTGVNLPEGKNLVGAFWQPSAVLCDLDYLDTLPPREARSGWGELAKYHFLAAEPLDALDLEAKVARCVEIKAAFVAEDEREGGSRALLNYGHTLGHALETAGRYDLRHGEAVAIGLMFAAVLARALGRIDDARVDYHREVLTRYDLPVQLPPRSDPDELVAIMARDKKALDGLTFVLDGEEGVAVVQNVDADVVRAALKDFA